MQNFPLKKRNDKNQNIMHSTKQHHKRQNKLFIISDKLEGYFEFQEVRKASHVRRVRPRITLAQTVYDKLTLAE